MSSFAKNQIFNEPNTQQFGSHMVMTNVQKELKKKYISVDTKNSEEYNSLMTSNYNISLPERINDIKKLSVTNIEIPKTYYSISENLGNNYPEPMFAILNFAKITDNPMQGEWVMEVDWVKHEYRL